MAVTHPRFLRDLEDQMNHQLRSRMAYMANVLKDHVPELMEPSPLIDQDGRPYPDTPSGIFGEFHVNRDQGEISIRFDEIPRNLTAVSVRLVRLDMEGKVEEEVPFLRLHAKQMGKGESITFPIPLRATDV